MPPSQDGRGEANFSLSDAPTESTPLLSTVSSSASSGSQAERQSGAEQVAAAAAAAASRGDAATYDETPTHILLPTMIALFSAILLAAVDGVLVTTLLAPISSSFGQSQKAAWLGTSYLISTTAFCTTFGKLADVLGRRSSMLLALFFFGLGTIGCALAPSMNLLIAARGVAGIGGAGVQTLASIIMSDLVPLRQRALWQGITNVVFCIGTSGGAPLGGLISVTIGWRYGFAIQVPLMCLSAVLVSIFVRIPPSEAVRNQTLRIKIQRFDLPGIIALVIAVASSQLAISFWSSEELPFSDPRVSGLLLLTASSLAIFIYIEEYISKEPVVPFRMLRNRNFALSSIFFFLTSFSLFIITFHLPLFFETVLLLSPAQAGLRVSPCSLAVSVGSVSAGIYIRQRGKFKKALNISNVVTICAAILLCNWNRNTTPPWAYFVSPMPLGFGAGFTGTVGMISLLSSLQREDIARATGFMYLARHLGGVMGVGSGGAIMQAALRFQLTKRIHGPNAQETIDFIRHNAAALVSLPDWLRVEAIESYQVATQTVFTVAAVGLTITFLICLPLREMDSGQMATPASTATTRCGSGASDSSNEQVPRGRSSRDEERQGDTK